MTADKADPMTEPLECAEPGCDALHPNAVAADASMKGWRCGQHEHEDDWLDRAVEEDRERHEQLLRDLASKGGKGGDFAFTIEAQEGPKVPLSGQDFELPTMFFQTGAGAHGGCHGAFVFRFGDDDDCEIKLTPDGCAHYGKSYEPLRTAREFWRALGFMVPLQSSTMQRCWSLARLYSENAKAGRDQALEMGHGELAARLHAVYRQFDLFAGELEAMGKLISDYVSVELEQLREQRTKLAGMVLVLTAEPSREDETANTRNMAASDISREQLREWAGTERS